MSQRFGSLVVVACLALACQSSDAKRVEPAGPVESVERGLRVATTLAPEDLGMDKWVFSDAPPVGEVMVVHWECVVDSPDGRERSVHEFISHTRGAPYEVSIVHVPGRPSAADPNPLWQLKGCGASTGMRGHLRRSRSGRDDLDLEFDVGDGVTCTFRYRLRREPVEAVRARYPTLREISDEAPWGYSGVLESEDEPQK